MINHIQNKIGDHFHVYFAYETKAKVGFEVSFFDCKFHVLSIVLAYLPSDLKFFFSFRPRCSLFWMGEMGRKDIPVVI